MAINYEQAKVLLNNSYEKAAQELPAAVTQYITDNKDALDTIFSSKTQSYQGDWKKGIGDHLYIPGRIPESDPADPAGRANKPKKGGMICGKKKQKGNCGAPCTGDRSLLPRWSLCAAFR